jgi:site-specific DNA recombinase
VRRKAAPDTDDVYVALLYRRVSSDDQAREGLSLDTQRARTRRYAARLRWAIGGEYEDVLAGTRDDRPGYRALLAEARRLRRNGRPVTIVVQWLDRLGRSVYERARCADELRALSVSIHSVMEGGEVPEIVANILAAVAQEEVRRLGERIATVRRHVDSAGWHYPTRAAWGYQRRPATPDERAAGAPHSVLIIDPERAPYVQEVWRRAAEGESIYAIASWVQSLSADVRGNRRMSYQMVRRLLRAPVYVARTTRGDPDVLSRPVAHWPALVSDDLWWAVQERMAEAARRPRAPGRRHLLGGLLRCPRCGYGMTGRRLSRQASRYVCTRTGYGIETRSGRCLESALMTQIDSLVLAAVAPIVEVIMTAGGLPAHVAERLWRQQEMPPAQAARERLRRADYRMARARQCWTDVALRFVDGEIDKQQYERLRAVAQGEMDQAEAEQCKLAEGRTKDRLPELAAVLAEAAGWAQTLQSGTTLARRSVLQRLIERVVPRRTERSRYDVEITWTPVATAIHGLLVAARPRE